MADDESTRTPPAKKATKSSRLGESGEAVRQNIRRLRDAQGISGAQLAATMKRLGRPIPLVGIQRIESGERRVDVDDLMAFAVALNVAPATLLMPDVDADGAEVQSGNDLVAITGWHKPISARPVWDWIGAEKPLIHGTDFSFYSLAWPRWVQELRLSLIKFPGEDGYTDGND